MDECNDELLGVVGTALVVVLEARAVRGVGALICDFFGVSITCLLRLVERLDEDSKIFPGEELTTLTRLLPVTKGCRMAACGLIRFSGSQVKHFATKSTKSSSLHLKT